MSSSPLSSSNPTNPNYIRKVKFLLVSDQCSLFSRFVTTCKRVHIETKVINYQPKLTLTLSFLNCIPVHITTINRDK